jgi:hypothetical protein
MMEGNKCKNGNKQRWKVKQKPSLDKTRVPDTQETEISIVTLKRCLDVKEKVR